MKPRGFALLAATSALLLLTSTIDHAQGFQRCPSIAVLPDTAYPDALAVKEFLGKHGYVVRCVTNSTMQGTAELSNVAGFQADQGTFTVFFLPHGEDVKVIETPAPHGYYRYSFVRTVPGHRSRHYSYKVNGREYYFRHGDWLFLVWDASIADRLRDLL